MLSAGKCSMDSVRVRFPGQQPEKPISYWITLIEMGKIKPFTLVMSDGMVQEKVGSEERLNHVLLERMLVEEIIPMAEKNISLAVVRKREVWQACPWVLYRQPGL